MVVVLGGGGRVYFRQGLPGRVRSPSAIGECLLTEPPYCSIRSSNRKLPG